MSTRLEKIGGFLQTAAVLASLAVAIAALFLAINTEERSARRFEEQLLRAQEQLANAREAAKLDAERTERQLSAARTIAEMSVRPLLAIASSGTADRKGVILRNSGLGAAVITKVEFRKGERLSRNLAELLKFNIRVKWENFFDFGEAVHFLKAGESKVLAAISLRNLTKQGLTTGQSIALLEDYEQEISGLSVLVEYEDVLGNPQEPIRVGY